MKKHDVKIGEEYLTRVSGELVRVRVIMTDYARSRFTVRRCDDSRILPKRRSAAALRPLVAREPTEADIARQAKARHAATRRRLLRVRGHRDFAAQFHAAVRFREVTREAREFRARCAAVGLECPDASFRAWLRAVLRAHLTNRATWIAVTDAVSAVEGLRRAKSFDRRGFGCSVDAARIAPMLDADPSIVEGIMSLVRGGAS